ncbi:unnamed protein product, partial [Coregonus sp. 'balchen']
MEQSKANILSIITWNTCGVKPTKRSPNKRIDIMNYVKKQNADKDRKTCMERDGKTLDHLLSYSPSSKGVAIQVNKNIPHYEYICHDEDYTGGYIMLFCRLYGKHFTIVNVYNHKEDKKVLKRLSQYLQEIKIGTLVIGGDFNTALDFDKRTASEHRRHTSLRPLLQFRFLTEPPRHMVKTTNNRRSLLSFSEHQPLLIGDSETTRRQGKISGAEVLVAMKSLTDSTQSLPYEVVTSGPDYYTRSPLRLDNLMEIERLKHFYNEVLAEETENEKLPKGFNREYKIFATILANCLLMTKTSLSPHCTVTLVLNGKTQLNWKFLSIAIRSIKAIPLQEITKEDTILKKVLSQDLGILQKLLLRVKHSCIHKKHLHHDCPLTPALLSLCLKHMEDDIFQIFRTMAMSGDHTLRFVTWNIRGKGYKKSSKTEKLGLVFKQLITLKASITFLQETHIGPKDIDLFEIATSWKSYFTVYSTQSKGAAILVNKNIEQHYQYICHDEEPTGSYIVLFCKLYGQSFTLVNLYNHAKDTRVLETLTHYLQEMATGILVVGGDFNTVIDPDIDRFCATGTAQYTLLRRFLEEFTSSLNLVDIWGRLNRTKKDFSRSEKKSHSRLDMFFMPEDTIWHAQHCEIHKGKRLSDHMPVSLELCLPETDRQFVPEQGFIKEKLGHSEPPDMRTEKISGAEVLMAMKSLIDSGQRTPDGSHVIDIKQNCQKMTDKFKLSYNKMLRTKNIPKEFKQSLITKHGHNFSVKYIIFATVLARRLRVFLAPSFKSRKKKHKPIFSVSVILREVPKEICCLFLNNALSSMKAIRPPPPRDFSILRELLPNVVGSAGSKKQLLQGCPLTPTIITLSLTHLASIARQHLPDTTVEVFRHRQCLYMYMPADRYSDLRKLLSNFVKESGLNL